MDNILEMDLSPEDGKLLKEALESWKEEVYASLLEKVEEAKERKLEELEEASIEYKENLKKEYSDKMLKTLKEMEKDIRAKVVAEVVADNPEVQVLEQIKELIAPTLNEDYAKNVYTEEIQTLRENIEVLENRMEIEEGARRLAELVSPYSKKTQNLIISLVNEGGPDKVSEQFYSIIESLSMNEEDEDWDDEEELEDDDWNDDDEFDDEDEIEDEDPMLTMPKVDDYDSMEEFGQAIADWQEAQGLGDEEGDDLDDEDEYEDDEDEMEDDLDDEMEESYKGSSVKEGKKGKKVNKKVNEAVNDFKQRMLNLSE